MPLRLQIKSAPAAPVELPGLTPASVRGLALDEVERLPIFLGNQRRPLAELFAVAGNPADGQIHFAGDLSGVHRIGAGMADGEIRIEGNAGRHLGAEMSGGRIDVSGSAGDWLGCQMRGGAIHVHGRAGDHAAAAYPGSPRGMTGGQILIDGDAGDDLGTALRRGLVAVGRSAGDRVGNRMLAGTILVAGSCGKYAGTAMRRGTIALLGPPPELPLTFVRANRWEPPLMRLLLGHLAKNRFPVPEEWLATPLTSFSGDMLESGRGEMLLRI